jgi:chromosome segregation ATPase
MAKPAEREGRVKALHGQVAAETDQVTELSRKVSAKRLEKEIAIGDRVAGQRWKPVTMPEREVDPKALSIYEFNEDHGNLLRAKRDEVAPLLAEVERLRLEKNTLEDELGNLVGEVEDFQTDVTEWTEAICRTSAEGDRLQTESEYLEKQLAERRTEIRMLERLKADADAAYSQLAERAANGDALRGGRLDVEKSIDNLRNQLSDVRAQIAAAESELGRLEDDTQAADAQLQTRRENFEEAVDWQSERQDLRAELKSLLEEIANRKSCLTTGEQRNAARIASITKYGPLVTKWQGRTGPDAPPAKSIAQMWQEMEEAKKKSAAMIEVAEKELNDLMARNAKLEDEVARSRQVLERTISQFYAEENQFRKRIDERRQKAEAEENKLLRQIQDARLRLAQKHLGKL